MATFNTGRMQLIDFLKLELGQDFFTKKILQSYEYAALRLKEHIARNEILLWTTHFAQGRNADISQAFEGFTPFAARDFELPNMGGRSVLKHLEKKYGSSYRKYGDLPALVVKGGRNHIDYFLIGCIDVLLLVPIDKIFPSNKQQGGGSSTAPLASQLQQISISPPPPQPKEDELKDESFIPLVQCEEEGKHFQHEIQVHKIIYKICIHIHIL